MKHLILFLIPLLMLSWLTGCTPTETTDIAATTLPVYEFTVRICEGTGLTVTRLVTENVSCLHDYTLQVSQMQAIQGADVVILSGGGLEDFMEDALQDAQLVIDASRNLSLLHSNHKDHSQAGHVHEEDPHIWLSPVNAKVMANNICRGLTELYPGYADVFHGNLQRLETELDALQTYGEEVLADLSCRELITFHDGFSYFAESFHLEILESVEEESGSEASASQLIYLTTIVKERNIPAIFTEINGSASAADIVAAETGVKVYQLDMAMGGNSYFDAIKYNIDIIREAMQ